MSVVFEAPRFGPFLLNILELTKGTVHLCCVSSTFCLSLPQQRCRDLHPGQEESYAPFASFSFDGVLGLALDSMAQATNESVCGYFWACFSLVDVSRFDLVYFSTQLQWRQRLRLALSVSWSLPQSLCVDSRIFITFFPAQLLSESFCLHSPMSFSVMNLLQQSGILKSWSQTGRLLICHPLHQEVNRSYFLGRELKHLQ